jgi:DNA-binding transcriptional regulator YhcF (GntR family)
MNVAAGDSITLIEGRHDVSNTHSRRNEPRWLAIANGLQEAIVAGVLPPGARTPSEFDLANRHHVSRPTAVRALTHLATAGYLERRQGIGTFVAASTPIPEAGSIRMIELEPTEFSLFAEKRNVVRWHGRHGDVLVAVISIEGAAPRGLVSSAAATWPTFLGDGLPPGHHRHGSMRTAPTEELTGPSARIDSIMSDDFTGRSWHVRIEIDLSKIHPEIIVPLAPQLHPGGAQ